MKIFAIGASGLVGSRIAELLREKYVVDNLSLETGLNITDASTLDSVKKDTEHPIVFHLAAKADVDGCEKDKSLGEEGDAYKINVLGTQNIINACRESKKKLIYVSTDFVFDGKNPPSGGYTEEDTPNPINWYAETKYKGEEIVKDSGTPYTIMRIAYPYRADEFAMKKDFVHAIKGRLEQKLPVAAVTDHLMTPVFIDDIAYALDKLIETESLGIFHVVGSQSLSPYDAANLIAEKFGFDKALISKTTLTEFFQGRAPRPFNLTLNNAKIQKLGVKMRTFEEGLQIVES